MTRLSQSTILTTLPTDTLHAKLDLILQELLTPPPCFLRLTGTHTEPHGGSRVSIIDFDLYHDCSNNVAITQVRIARQTAEQWESIETIDFPAAEASDAGLMDRLSSALGPLLDATEIEQHKPMRILVDKCLSQFSADEVSDKAHAIAKGVAYGGSVIASASFGPKDEDEASSQHEHAEGSPDANESVPHLQLQCSWTIPWPFEVGDHGQRADLLLLVKDAIVRQEHGIVKMQPYNGHGLSPFRRAMRYKCVMREVASTTLANGMTHKAISFSQWGTDVP